jgi:hypothetical protein
LRAPAREGSPSVAYRPAHRGVDVDRVLAGVAGAQALVASGSLVLPSPDL